MRPTVIYEFVSVFRVFEFSSRRRLIKHKKHGFRVEHTVVCAVGSTFLCYKEKRAYICQTPSETNTPSLLFLVELGFTTNIYYTCSYVRPLFSNIHDALTRGEFDVFRSPVLSWFVSVRSAIPVVYYFMFFFVVLRGFRLVFLSQVAEYNNILIACVSTNLGRNDEDAYIRLVHNRQ